MFFYLFLQQLLSPSLMMISSQIEVILTESKDSRIGPFNCNASFIEWFIHFIFNRNKAAG